MCQPGVGGPRIQCCDKLAIILILGEIQTEKKSNYVRLNSNPWSNVEAEPILIRWDI